HDDTIPNAQRGPIAEPSHDWEARHNTGTGGPKQYDPTQRPASVAAFVKMQLLPTPTCILTNAATANSRTINLCCWFGAGRGNVLRCWLANLPNQPKPTQKAEDIIADIHFPPKEALVG